LVRKRYEADGRMLKTGAPELLREEYDTLFSESIVRGEAFLAEQETKRAELAEVAAAIGVDLDSLRPGEAVGVGKRRRGWKEGAVIKDWSRSAMGVQAT
jgi:hypothetical protein